MHLGDACLPKAHSEAGAICLATSLNLKSSQLGEPVRLDRTLSLRMSQRCGVGDLVARLASRNCVDRSDRLSSIRHHRPPPPRASPLAPPAPPRPRPPALTVATRGRLSWPCASTAATARMYVSPDSGIVTSSMGVGGVIGAVSPARPAGGAAGWPTIGRS